MSTLQTILTVRESEGLMKAIAAEVTTMDDKDLSEDFLEQMSTQYPHRPGAKRTVVENLDEQGGQDFNGK